MKRERQEMMSRTTSDETHESLTLFAVSDATKISGIQNANKHE